MQEISKFSSINFEINYIAFFNLKLIKKKCETSFDKST